MATTLFITHDTRRKRKDNTYPLVYRLYHERVNTSIPTGYSIKIKDWDETKQMIRKSCKDCSNIYEANQRIQLYKSKLLNNIQALSDAGILNSLNITELKSRLTKSNTVTKSKTLFDYTFELIAKLKNEGSINTARTYKEAINFVGNYNDGEDVYFTGITPEFLTKLEKRYMSKRTNSYGGLSVYLRAIRSIFNKAIAAGIVGTNHYPFRRNQHEIGKYKIKQEKTRKRAITKEQIKMIEAYQPDLSNRNLVDARNFFLFSFYMRGINFVDMAYLKRSNILENTLIYMRSKTGKRYEIAINEKAKSILLEYGLETKLKTQFLFPIIKRDGNPELVNLDIRNHMKVINTQLKKIARDIGLNVPLTTYVSRHSWATIADKEGIDRRIISQGLGHANLQTTDIYIDDIVSGDDLAAADDIIIN